MTSDILSTTSRPARRKTKIVATVGPASRSPEKIRKLIDAGVNVFRLNFSHGTHEEHFETLGTIREVAKQLGAHIAVLQDLCGPKIRISPVEGDFTQIPDGTTVELRPADGSLSSAGTIYVETVNPLKYLKPGQPVLLADGIMELKARELKPTGVICDVVKGGRLRSRVGIAFPDSGISVPAATDKDIVDLKWGIRNHIDYVALSFVKDESDVIGLRKIIKDEGGDAHIIAKIERKDALTHLQAIIDVSDGIMVARGDLGLELPLEQLPTVQKRMIEQANHRGIPVIVATQMLTSMVTSIRPTRAEVSDIAAAVMHGADALMLSEESAIGDNPVESVQYLSRIAQEAEKSFAFEEYKLRLRDQDLATVPDAVAYAACAAAIKVHAHAIIACTASGKSARLAAKYRPQQPLFGSSSKEATLRRMNLYWGVTPISSVAASNHYEEIEIALTAVQSMEELPNGSRAVITGGLIVGKPGATSVLEIKEIQGR